MSPIICRVPRKAEPPERELAICQRLRAFRESTKIPRTVFAADSGIVGARLLNCELGVTPLSYGLFKAINRRFFVRPDWLVYELGAVTTSRPFDDSEFSDQIQDRELLSTVCDRLFKSRFEDEAQKANQTYFGPDGFVERLAFLLDDFNDPERRKLIPEDVIARFADSLEKAARLVKASVAQSKNVQKIVRRTATQRTKKKRGT